MNTKQSQSVATSGSARSVRTMPFVVLHIEDSPDDRELFQMAAAQAKLPVCWQTANSTKTAIAHLKNLLSAAHAGAPVTWPDLVLLDFIMPVENGVGVLQFMKAHAGLRNLPIVVLTGCEDQAIADQATALGARAVKLKPLSFEGLVELMETIYRSYRYTPQENQRAKPWELHTTRLGRAESCLNW